MGNNMITIVLKFTISPSCNARSFFQHLWGHFFVLISCYCKMQFFQYISCQAIFCQLGPLTTCLAQLYLFVRHSYSLKSIRKTSFHLKENYSIISLVDNIPLKIKYSYLQYFFLQKLRTYVTLEKIPNNYIFLRTCSGYWKMQVLTREYFDRSELKFVWQVIF